MLNKPAGVISATEDSREKTVLDLLRDPLDGAQQVLRRGLFPVGRLDKDTEGLLLITDDGLLAQLCVDTLNLAIDVSVQLQRLLILIQVGIPERQHAVLFADLLLQRHRIAVNQMIFGTAAAAHSTAQQTGDPAVKQTQRRTGNRILPLLPMVLTIS
jgi:hypothetical protein